MAALLATFVAGIWLGTLAFLAVLWLLDRRQDAAWEAEENPLLARMPEPDDYSWTGTPIHDRLLAERLRAELDAWNDEAAS